jgi:hypothetical protein
MKISSFAAHYESFEILWAKRVSDVGQNSLKYWFLQRFIKFI